jgi:hypothetical protein
MMPDWYVFLSPLALIPMALLCLFLGCVGDDPSPPSSSLLKLNMDRDLQKTTTTDTRQVKMISVAWSLWSLGSPTTVPKPAAEILPTDAADEFLDPSRDPGAEYTVPAAMFPLDHVSCTCHVSIGLSSDPSLDETLKVESATVPLTLGTTYIFKLTPKPPASGTSKREFILEEYTPA